MKKSFLIFFITIILFNQRIYSDHLASHGEVAVFRARSQAAIAAKKLELKTQLDVVGALGVLDQELTGKQLDHITFSRLVLGMMMGNGYRDGVTTKLTATPVERAAIERIVKKATAYARNLNFVKDQVWKTNTTDAAVETHIKVLNGWKARTPEEDPCLDYTARTAEAYKNLDQIIQEKCASFTAANHSRIMINQAQRLCNNLDYGLMIKQFILTFSELSAADQLIITNAYTKEIRLAFSQDDKDAEFQLIVLQCQNKKQALDFIQERAALGPLPVFAPPPAPAVLVPLPTKSAPPVAAADVRNDDGVDITKINSLLEELRQFDTSSRSGRYDDVSKTILIMKTLYERKDEIISFAKSNWENVRQIRDINSVAHPSIKISKSSNQCSYFRAVIEDYVIRIQYDLRDRVDSRINYAPVFETVEYVFGGPMVGLPTDKDTIDFIFTTITTHLIDGARMLAKAAIWLEKNPAYYRNFFMDNWGDNSGCIPKRNDMLSNWIDANTKENIGKYVYENILNRGDFPIQVGKLINLFRQNCFAPVIKSNPALKYASDTIIENTQIFKNIYNKEKFVRWAQEVVRTTYQLSVFPRGFEYCGWNNAKKIGDVWNAVIGD